MGDFVYVLELAIKFGYIYEPVITEVRSNMFGLRVIVVSTNYEF